MAMTEFSLIFSSVGTSNEGSILTPTDVSVDNPLQTTRRDSSGVLQSPGLQTSISILLY